MDIFGIRKRKLVMGHFVRDDYQLKRHCVGAQCNLQIKIVKTWVFSVVSQLSKIIHFPSIFQKKSASSILIDMTVHGNNENDCALICSRPKILHGM